MRHRIGMLGFAGFVMLAHLAGAEPGEARRGEPAARGQQQSPGSALHTYGLKRCLQLAQQNYPRVHEARAKLEHSQALLRQAYTAPFSEFTMTGGIGPAPTVRGTALYSPNTDVTLSSNMALAWQIGIDGTVPLWTFGKLESTWAAARANIKASEHEVQKEKNDVKLSVRRAYYGIQLARDSRHLLGDAVDQIDKYLGALAKKVAEGEIDDVQLLKARIYRAELAARLSEAARQERVALAGLKFLTGVQREFDIPDEPLRKVEQTLHPLPVYLRAARLYRPEVNMARAGVLARRAQVELERARFYPDLGVNLSWRWARAPEVANQLNPFVYDVANYFHLIPALGVRWKLDFLPQAARLSQAQSDLEQMRATERAALGGVGVEVEQAYLEARDGTQRVEAYSEAVHYARQWLIKVQQGIDIGTYEEPDIIDPARQYALDRFAQSAATMDYNIAMARLALTTGWDEVSAD